MSARFPTLTTRMYCIALLVMAVVSPAAWSQVAGAGATFPSRVYARWAQQFESKSGIQVTYTGTGSGDGVRQISERRVDFAGTDSPLAPDELEKRKVVQVPTVVGGIVPVVNLTGVGDGQIRLDGPTLAAIEQGLVTQWNDERVAALNLGLSLPKIAIKRIVRKEKSGTTEGFTRYLSAASVSFQSTVGISQLPPWPGPTIAAEGNDGVVRTLNATLGGIAYVSYDRVKQDGLAGVKLKNAAGQYVSASEAGFRSAILESDLAKRGDDLAPLTDRPGANTWPISTATFVLFDAEPKTAEGASRVLRYVYWCFVHGDELTKGTGFAPLPTSVQSRMAARFARVKPGDGRPMDYISF